MLEIDLSKYFNPDALRETFIKLQEAKTDRYNHLIDIKMGADGITFDDFQKNVDRNVQEISRKVLSGRYYFYPLREVDIPKDGHDRANGIRTLSIARIADALVQKQLYEALYDRFEALFGVPSVNKVSFAYRKGKSTHDAIRGIWRDYQRGYEYVLDADLSKFFDTLSHERLMSLLESLVGDCPVALNLLWRYVRTPSVRHAVYKHKNTHKYFRKTKPPRTLRNKGVPQGGVLSGMLANLYLHGFDKWLVEDARMTYDLRYYRYADDFVVLTRSIEDARALYNLVLNYISKIHLKLHPLDSEKTRLVFIPNDGLNFLGFRITRDEIEIKHKNIRRFKQNFLASIHRLDKPKYSFRDASHKLDVLIRYYVNSKISGPDDICPKCHRPIQHRNWMSYFAPVITNMHQIHDLDIWLRKSLRQYLWENFKIRTKPRDFRRHGMTSLMKEYRRCHKLKLCTCEPEIAGDDDVLAGEDKLDADLDYVATHEADASNPDSASDPATPQP